MRTVTIDGVKKTFHEAHQDLWNELSQNQGMTKGDYFELHDFSIYPRNLCFACESCDGCCESCPVVKWRDCANAYDEIFPCNYWMNPDGYSHVELFGRWSNLMKLERFDEACEIAAEIANLEWKEVEE